MWSIFSVPTENKDVERGEGRRRRKRGREWKTEKGRRDYGGREERERKILILAGGPVKASF
jgi:hypothetical protein